MLPAPLRSPVIGLVVALLLSGCTAGDENVTPTASSAAPPPAPKVVFDGGVDACTTPVQTASIRERFIVEDGFDELIIEFGESGAGQVTPAIRYPEENKVVWGGNQRNVNTVSEGQTCGDHGAHGAGETLKVEPGEYEASLQYTGSVDVNFVITARSSRDNMTDHSGHMG